MNRIDITLAIIASNKSFARARVVLFVFAGLAGMSICSLKVIPVNLYVVAIGAFVIFMALALIGSERMIRAREKSEKLRADVPQY